VGSTVALARREETDVAGEPAVAELGGGSTAPTTAEAIGAHRAAGESFAAGGVSSFVRAAGDGDPIVLMHGLPSSS
jgi:hypothetical protein